MVDLDRYRHLVLFLPAIVLFKVALGLYLRAREHPRGVVDSIALLSALAAVFLVAAWFGWRKGKNSF